MKLCPYRFKEFTEQSLQECIGELCKWFEKCSQSHAEPIYGMKYGNIEWRQVIGAETSQEPREADENACTQDSREKLESDIADSLCLFAHYAHDHYERETVMQMVADRKSEFAAFLDRQATITRFQETSNQPNSGFVAQKQPESTENDTAKSEIRDFDDTREKLEAEILDDIEHFVSGEWVVTHETIADWLDRQTAITERECLESEGLLDKYLKRGEKIDDLQNLVDELRAEAVELRKENTALIEENGDLQVRLDESNDQAYELLTKAKRLENERDYWKLHTDCWADKYKQRNEEANEYAEKLEELERENAKLSSDELHWHSEADYWKRQYELICKAVEDVARNYTVVDEDGEVVS